MQDQPGAESEDEHAQQGHDHVDREPEHAAVELQLDLAVEQAVRGLGEAAGLAALEPERLDHGLRPVVLRGDREHAARLLLDGDAALLGALGHRLVDRPDDGRTDQGDDGQQRIEDHEHDGRHDQREDLRQPAAQRLRQPLLEHADIGEEAGEDVTLLALGVPGLRQRLHLDEHLAAQLAHHRRAHVGGEVGAAQAGEQGHDERREQDGEDVEHLGEVAARDGLVQQLLEGEREDDREGEAEQQVDEHLHLAPDVGAQVAGGEAQELPGLDVGGTGVELGAPGLLERGGAGAVDVLGGGVEPAGLGGRQELEELGPPGAVDQEADEGEGHGRPELAVRGPEGRQVHRPQLGVGVGGVGDEEAVALEQRPQLGTGRQGGTEAERERAFEGLGR